jgi:hypothetical protein
MRTPSTPEPEAASFPVPDPATDPEAQPAAGTEPTAPGPEEPTPPTRQRKRRLRKLLKRRSVRIVLGVLAVCFGWLCWSIGSAIAAPGNDSLAAKVAEWGRDHHLGPVVTFLESAQYKANPPKIGGTPNMALKPEVAADAPSTVKPALKPIVLPRLISPAGTPLAGEGNWQVLGSVRGTPAVMGAYVRPDDEHTSYVAGVVSMDQRVLRFDLHPGESDPGPDKWGVPPDVPAGARTGLLATFNGGFKVDEALGGFYLNGITHGTLAPGGASLVYYKDGHAKVGAWGKDVTMTPDVAGVRQNLKLIVDKAQVPESVDNNVESGWGLTIEGKYFVWRSGVGITKDGRLVYVYGPALSVRTLADLLKRAGCTEAMQLDINPAWMSFMYYKPVPDPKNPSPVKLLPSQERPANRYYEPTSRDFTAVFAK